MDAAKNELVRAYEPFINDPPSYPGYLQLWESFWKTRYQELRAGAWVTFKLIKFSRVAVENLVLVLGQEPTLTHIYPIRYFNLK